MNFYSYFDGKHSFHKYFLAVYIYLFIFILLLLFFFGVGGGGVMEVAVLFRDNI